MDLPTLLMIVVVLAAAGAGAWYWLRWRARRRANAYVDRASRRRRVPGEGRSDDHLDAAELLTTGPGPEPDEPPAPGAGPARAPARPARRDELPQMELGLDPRRAASPPGGVIALFVEVGEDRRLAGTDVVEALRTVGMQFGDMRIFHHHGIGQLRREEPLFSAANMFEPGEFDLSQLTRVETRGLALFMQYPGPADPPVVLELMLNTAQRLAEILGAGVCDERHQPLDAAGTERLRARLTRRDR